MKKLIVLVALSLLAPIVSAETGISGTWATGKNVQPSMVMEFTSSGTTLTGTVRPGEGPGPTMPVLDGKVTGNTVTFKTVVNEQDGPYALMFSGHRTGNTIKFKCEVEVNPPGEKVALGPACLQSVTVRRTSR